ncbi:MAG: hypothetical protein HY808_01905 [Nitrospirae bacterium]|nr:hypothetical protein [Nitrospirota bacterium]
MKKLFTFFVVTILASSFAIHADANVAINFDDVSNLTVIDNQYSTFGVIFSTYGAAGYSDGHAYARNSSLSASSPNVIGGNKSGYTYLNDTYIAGRADFSTPANNVEIWARPFSTDNLFAWMKAYDTNGNLLDTINISGSVQGEASLLSIMRPDHDISRVEFSGANKRVTFDNFSVNVAPEPVSSILFITGGAVLGVRRYFKKKKSGKFFSSRN